MWWVAGLRGMIADLLFRRLISLKPLGCKFCAHKLPTVKMLDGSPRGSCSSGVCEASILFNYQILQRKCNP